ncbi:MAG: SDR family oxidoreductase [Armatimonadota bacterium]
MMEYQRDWALVLGASSGMGAAIARAFARAGVNIAGVHLDRRATQPQVDAVVEDIGNAGVQALFFNINAADAEKRAEVIKSLVSVLHGCDAGGRVRVLVHSLAFGALRPFVADESSVEITPAQLAMTYEVMANSLIYWTQDLLRYGLLCEGGRIIALTSAGGHRVWRDYGAVSAAKAALEAHIRQLAVELAPRHITANAIQAGVTDTPALRKVPGHEAMIAYALQANPHGRLTTPEDIAQAVVALSAPGTSWMTGNVIRVDGGEDITG